MSTQQRQRASYVAVPDAVAAATGAIVWWRLAGDTRVEALAEAFVECEIPDGNLPSLVGTSTALQRAMLAAFGKGGGAQANLIRGTSTGAKALVTEVKEGDGSLTYTTGLTAQLNDAGDPVFDPPDHPQVDRVRAHYTAQLDLYSSSDIGSWLVKIVELHDGVRLRDTGGVYFVPAKAIPSWEVYVRAIHKATAHRCNTVPSMKSTEAVASILDALVHESTAIVEDLEASLAAEPSKRKAQGAMRRCEAQIEKIAAYSDIVGLGAQKLVERLDELKAQFTVASLVDGAS